MLGEILKKEVREIFTSAKFVFTFVLCSVLILLSVIMAISNFRADRQEYDKAVALNKQELEARTSYIDLVAFGIKVYKQPQILRTIVNGIASDAGLGLRIAAGSDPQSVDSKYQTNPVLSVFGNLDLGFVVRVVLSLLALLFTYDSITGEKEKGTLRLVLSNRVPREKLILGKALGGLSCLLLSLIVPFVLALLMLAASPRVSLTADDWLRIGLLFVQFLLYISVFFMLGLLVSARTHRSSTSFLVLIFIWVTFVTIIPKISVMVAAQWRPIPSANDTAVRKDQFLQGLFRETESRIRAFTEQNPPPKKREEQVAWRDRIMKLTMDAADERQTKYEEFAAAVDREYQLKKSAQDRLAANLSRISPAGALMFASMSLARTGLDEHQRFVDAVRQYWPIWYKWSDSKIREPTEPGPPGGKLDLLNMPQFTDRPEGIGLSLRRALPDYGIMGFMIILFFAGAYWSFVRYDVR